MRYFGHDTNAWKDEKIGDLCLTYGLAGYGLYWVIVETLHSEEQPVNLSETEPLTKLVARWFGVGCDWVLECVRFMVSCGLLKQIKGRKGSLIVSSDRVEENITRYQAKCETARQNGKKGGRKPNRNQSANRIGTNPQPSRLADGNQSGGNNKKKNKTVLDSDKHYPNTDTCDAAAFVEDTAAPPVLPTCPDCGGALSFSLANGVFSSRCAKCDKDVGISDAVML